MLLSDVTPTPDLTCADIKEPDLFVDAGCEWMDTGFSTTQETTERSGSTKTKRTREAKRSPRSGAAKSHSYFIAGQVLEFKVA